MSWDTVQIVAPINRFYWDRPRTCSVTEWINWRCPPAKQRLSRLASEVRVLRAKIANLITRPTVLPFMAATPRHKSVVGGPFRNSRLSSS